MVSRLASDFPGLRFTLNGGLETLADCEAALGVAPPGDRANGAAGAPGSSRSGLAGKAPAGGSLLTAVPQHPASALPMGGGGGGGRRGGTKKVQLNELTWEDREKVLRTLFAKINAVQGRVNRMPEHPLGEVK